MTKIRLGLLIACLPLIQAFAHRIDGSTTTIAIQGTKYAFACGGPYGDQFIEVFVFEEKSDAWRSIASQQLDETDDCAQVTWTVSAPKTGAQLVMANPGRLGPGVHLLVFYADRDGVEFSGFLPVAADSSVKGQFRMIGDDAYGTWEKIYAFKNRKIYIAQELILMRSGSVCLEHNEMARINLPCAGQTINATATKPVCVRQRNGKGELEALRACTSLKMRR